MDSSARLMSLTRRDLKTRSQLRLTSRTRFGPTARIGRNLAHSLRSKRRLGVVPLASMDTPLTCGRQP